MEDWLRAERELVWVPQSETMEDDKQYRLRLIVPGLEAKDLQITAMPDAIIVQSEGAFQGIQGSQHGPVQRAQGQKTVSPV